MGSQTPDGELPVSDSLIREHCVGIVPLTARLEDWMSHTIGAGKLPPLVQRYGSPLNVICNGPMLRHIESFNAVAADRELDFQVFFARKSNKCISFVQSVSVIGAGIDVASLAELEQTSNSGIDRGRIICTAAIKDHQLLHECLRQRVTIAIDNVDELKGAAEIAREIDGGCSVAVRLSGFLHQGQKLPSRFGFDVSEIIPVVEKFWGAELEGFPLRLEGIHFHLDGYSAAQRVSAITQSLEIIDVLRQQGHSIGFLDIGGGIPIKYVDSADQWHEFCCEHSRALLAQRMPITYRNHRLGRSVTDDQVQGEINCYPAFQEPIQTEWLATVLDAACGGTDVADQLRQRQLQLRCEPGRSLLDGCGLTVARVEFRKQVSGDWLIGLSMNHTQCRTSSDDFLVDPILVPCGDTSNDDTAAVGPIDGYLVGAYCTESELLSLRKLRFQNGVRIGDLVVFPNTAGYLMHFKESRSHQFPLAKNVVVSEDATWEEHLDPIDSLAIDA